MSPNSLANLKKIKKWEIRNPFWQPKKGVRLINDELLAKWYEPASKREIEANYLTVIQLPEAELKEIVEDINKPMLVRIIIKNLLSKKWFDILERMLDRGIWKAIQKIESENKNETVLTISKEDKEEIDIILWENI